MNPPLQRSLKLCCLAVGSVLLSACAIEPSSSSKPAPIEEIGGAAQHVHHTAPTDTGTNSSVSAAPEPQPEAAPRPIQNPAAANLLEDAAQARAQGDYTRAQTLAERAQTLAPQEARAYLELSRIYEQRGDTTRARQMAIRGLSVVRDDPSTERNLQQLSAQ